MRDEMSGFDLRQVVSELSEYNGSHCKKIYQPHHEQIVLRINPKQKPQQDIVIVRGKRLYLSDRQRPMPAQPSPFAMLLRKHLGNARLTAVSQHGFDRIVTLDFDSKVGPRHLIIECFRDGNVILVDSTFTIIQPLTHAKYSGRILKKGEPYQFPPEATDPHELDVESLTNLLSNSERNVVKTLAGKASLGGPLANSVIQLAEIDGGAEASDIAKDSVAVGNISKSLSSILEQLKCAGVDEPGGWLVLPIEKLDITDEEQISASAVEASPVLMPAHRELHCIPFPRFVDAVDAWKGGHDVGALARRQRESIELVGGRLPSTESETLQRRLEQQKRTIEDFSKRIIEQQEIGHAIQENWNHVQDLLSQVKEAVEKDGWKQVKKQIKEIPWIESGNPAEGTIVAILPDEEGQPGEIKIRLDLNLSVHQNAQIYFENASKHKDKSKGAEAALAETENLLSRAMKKETKRKASGQVARIKRSKRLWFENHRWTIVDGMHLMVGGRDAKGNDNIVKKHLKADDRYFHADLHGAPSCALKLQQGFVEDPHPPSNLPPNVPAFLLSDNIEVPNFSEKACEQAATMSLCWSRGWNGGGGAGTAYWVKPGQVSKQAETGEYVARGAFIVRGQRNWYKDLELKLGLGLICINGIPLLLAGTIEQVSTICQRWIEILPGREKREKIAQKLSKATGLMIDDIVPVLPGNSSLGSDYELINPVIEEE